MAADQERADRIRALKQERPDLTWRRIAEYVGVTERSATDWQRKGGMDFDNAKKLAALFEVDVDYIWRGTETNTPSPFAGQDELTDRLDRLEQLILEDIKERRQQRDEIIARIATLERALLAETSALRDETAERLLRLGRAVVTGELPEEAAPDRQPARARRGGAAKKRAAKSRTP